MKSEIRIAIILGVVIVGGIAALSVTFSTLDQAVEPTIPFEINEQTEPVIPVDTEPQDMPVNTTQIDTETLDNSATETVKKAPKIDKSRFKQAPDIVGIADYVNITPEELDAKIKDNVVLYDIWTYSCINCIRTLPYITAWDEKYKDQGLLIIGIHSPEFEFEKDLDNVKTAVAKYNINYPVVLDNDKETWNAFENRYWPRKYIADHEGYIRYNHIGEGAYKETERVIQHLLKERSESFGMPTAEATTLVDIEEFQHTGLRTPELYFGYKFARGNQLGSAEGFKPDQTVTYADPEKIEFNKFYPVGTWKNTADNMELVDDFGSIILQYSAKEVNIVTGGDANLAIYIDGKLVGDDIAGSDVNSGIVQVSDPDLYNIISGDTRSSHLLEIRVDGPGFQIFTFTFG